jgi:hypothetical protein
MVRHTVTDGQIGSPSHEEQPRSTSEDPGLPGGDSKPLSQRTAGHSHNQTVEQWPVLLEEFDVQFLMLDTERDSELFELLQEHPAWSIDSQDSQSVLLVRTDVGPCAVSSQEVKR